MADLLVSHNNDISATEFTPIGVFYLYFLFVIFREVTPREEGLYDAGSGYILTKSTGGTRYKNYWEADTLTLPPTTVWTALSHGQIGPSA